jgi:hypothetical protein
VIKGWSKKTRSGLKIVGNKTAGLVGGNRKAVVFGRGAGKF